jgi:hypothetical protein
LDARWSVHKAPSNDTNSRLLFEEYGVETCSIHLLEEVKEDERVIKERWWIENTANVVNHMIPGRTMKEWYEANKEHCKQKKKEWREENKEYNKQRKKEYYEANKEYCNQKAKEWRETNKDYVLRKGKEYNEANKEKIADRDKAYREKNQERINAYDRKRNAIRVRCEVCDKDYRRDSINKHLKSKAHLDKVSLYKIV